MPPQFVKLILKTERPFVQLFTDMTSEKSFFFLDGRVMLVGDAVAAPRPHVAALTSQAIHHVSRTKMVLEGKIGKQQ